METFKLLAKTGVSARNKFNSLLVMNGSTNKTVITYKPLGELYNVITLDFMTFFNER